MLFRDAMLTLTRFAWILPPFLMVGCDHFNPFLKNDQDTQKLKNVVATGDIAPVSQVNAARLDQIGRQILSTNPFIGSAPSFALVGTKEPEIFHPNPVAIFVSEALVKECPDDDTLAGVLCLEMARINSEARNLTAMGLGEVKTDLPGHVEENDPDQADLAGGESVGGKVTVVDDKSRPQLSKTNDLAREWHKNAGFKHDSFEKALSIDRVAAKNHQASKQLIGFGAIPRWTK